jgi:hypothetical protein
MVGPLLGMSLDITGCARGILCVCVCEGRFPMDWGGGVAVVDIRQAVLGRAKGIVEKRPMNV